MLNEFFNGATPSSGPSNYTIERSLRFNSADSAHLSRTPSSAGNRSTWTWSGWIKRAKGAASNHVFDTAESPAFTGLYFEGNDRLDFRGYSGDYVWRLLSTQVFRDFGAWMHVVLQFNTTASTASDRAKVWVNGQQITAWDTADYPSPYYEGGVNNIGTHKIGGFFGAGYYDGYLADVHLIDGQALTASDFGEYDDNNVWQPKQYTHSTPKWIGDWAGDTTGTPYSSGTAARKAFDGNSATQAAATNSSSFTFTPSSPITGITKVRIRAQQDPGTSADILLNGSSIKSSWNSGENAKKEFTVNNLTSLEWQTDSGALWISVRSIEIEVDGVYHYLVQGGVNDFYLDFSDNSSSATLGNDSSGSNNDWTVNNLSVTSDAGNDSLIDTPTNYTASPNNGGNYCVMNPLDMNSNVATQNGNMEVSNATAGWSGIRGTLGVSSGKWYYELQTETASIFAGIATAGVDIYANNPQDSTSVMDDGALVYCDDGKYLLDQGGGANRQTYGSALANGDILGVAIDLDGNTVQFYKNGSALGSIDISSSPLASNTVFPYYISYYTSTSTFFNFGQRPFRYTPPAGYKSLCTTNLPDPTIADGSTAFDVNVWNGDGTSNRLIPTNFSPDFTWMKIISQSGQWHLLADSVRGGNKTLSTNNTNAEVTRTGFVSFDSNGFTIGDGNSNPSGGEKLVGFAWDAGDSTVSNTDGTIASSVRANPSAGISIVSWTGRDGTVGHGLNAKPGLILTKIRNSTSTWPVQHSALGTNILLLESTAAAAADSDNRFNATEATSSVFTAGTWWNSSSQGIAYCFAPVEGYSAFGSYTGNGSADGPFIYTGFRPRFILQKRADIGGTSWQILDTERDPFNLMNSTLLPESDVGEVTADRFDSLSNGFKVRTSNGGQNASGGTFIYAAFAEHPFKTARAR